MHSASLYMGIGLLVLLVIIVVGVIYGRESGREGFLRWPPPAEDWHYPSSSRGSDSAAAPYNLGVYDHPYKYPRYRGRAAKRWSADGRCVAYCGQTPCTVWCR